MVAVVPWGRRMDFDVDWQFDSCGTPQGFPEGIFLDLKLMLIARVLILTATASPKVRTSWLDAVRRGLENRTDSRPNEPRLLLVDRGFDFFSGENEGNKCGFATAACIGGKAAQTVAAVNHLFDG